MDAAGDVEVTDPTPAWAKLWSFESLRYRETGWWLDRILPHSPIGLVVAAIALPLAWFATGGQLAISCGSSSGC